MMCALIAHYSEGQVNGVRVRCCLQSAPVDVYVFGFGEYAFVEWLVCAPKKKNLILGSSRRRPVGFVVDE